jgi:hypothetical protein
VVYGRFKGGGINKSSIFENMCDFGMSCVGKEHVKDAAQNLIGISGHHQNLIHFLSFLEHEYESQINLCSP